MIQSELDNLASIEEEYKRGEFSRRILIPEFGIDTTTRSERELTKDFKDSQEFLDSWERAYEKARLILDGIEL
jgi:hypothetical protein